MNVLLRQPTNAEELRIALRNGIVHFSFVKKDGSLRNAKGTTNLSEVPSQFHPTTGRQSSPKVVVFFDLIKNEWRSAAITSLMFK